MRNFHLPFLETLAAMIKYSSVSRCGFRRCPSNWDIGYFNDV